MRRLLPIKLLALSCLLAACVTVNVYFPAAAAEQAADRIIDTVTSQQQSPTRTPRQRRHPNPGAAPVMATPRARRNIHARAATCAICAADAHGTARVVGGRRRRCSTC